MPAASEVIVPRRLGAYLIGRKLGAGGMATVFAARQQGTHVNRLVALKVLSANVSKEDDEHRAFVREALVATRLEHPNIVRTYDVGEVEGTLYLAMELVHGASLSACTKAQDGPLPTPIALKICGDIARALHAAHQLEDPEKGHLGVVHQDVSPQNILIGYDGTIKLVDFGVARFGTLEGSRTESLRGKPSYASPEQIAGKHIDRRTDIFALGVVLWELLAGTRLFKRETSAATYLAVLQDPIPDVRDANAYVPEELARVIAKALEREKEKRFATADELRLALVAAAEKGKLAEATAEQLAGWVTSLVVPTIVPAELEREIVKADGGLTPASRQSDPFGPSPSSAKVPPADVPDLDLPGVSHTRPAAQPRPPPSEPGPTIPVPRGSTPELGARPSSPNVRASSPNVPAAASVPRERKLETSDDFDMQIERDVSAASMASATSSYGMHAAPARPRASQAHIASTGLELAGERKGLVRERSDDEATLAEKAVPTAIVGVVFLAASGALIRVAHKAGGIAFAQVWPHAFDGTSAPESGIVSGVALVLAVAIGWAGVKLRPRSWALVVAATALLLTALAMVTVTLASTGEGGTPPDGIMLLPYSAPVALLGIALGASGRAAILAGRRSIARKLAAAPVILVAAALAFLAYETSFLVLH